MADKTTPKKTETTQKAATNDKGPKTEKPTQVAKATDKDDRVDKGDRVEKGNGAPKGDKPVRTDKGGDRGNREETKGEEKPYKRREPGDYHYKKPYYKRKEKSEREEITLKTEVPELPKKNERINQPDDAHFEKQVQALYAEVEELYAKMNDITKEEYNKVNSSARDTNTKSKSLRDLLTEKSDQRRTLRAELDVITEQMNGYRNAMEEYHDKSGRYKQHMKKYFKKEDIVKELEGLKHRQSHERLTIPEEKRIIKEIGELEKALPYAEPLEKLEIEFKDVREKKKELKKQVDEKYKTMKLVSSEITDIHTQLDSFRDVISKNKEEAAPTVKKIQGEYRDKIKEKRDRVITIKKEHDELWQKYEDQQELIRRIQYMQRVQERLRRDEERKKKWEEEQKLRDAEEAELRQLTIPYREEMELCDLLSSYLDRLKPKVSVEVPKEKTDEEKKAEIQSALQSDEWKKSKVQIMSSRKETDNDFFAGTQKNKKKNNAQKPKEKDARDEAAMIQHSIDILNYFDNLKISPPLVLSALDDAIKSLNEKREYFEKLSNEEKGKPVEKTQDADQKPKTEETSKKEETERKSPKKSKKHFEVTENDFPEIK